MAFELYKGPIPEGLLVLHTCDIPVCCNPNHLFLGTHQDNMDDMVKKNRQARNKGELSGSAKLTDEQVLEIFHSDLAGVKLAEKFNVHPTLISWIKHGKNWSHVTGLYRNNESHLQ